MRTRLLLTLALLVLLPAASFAQSSITFTPLMYAQRFTDRVTFILATQSPVVEVEAATGTYTAPCHTLRATLAAAVARAPQSYTSVFAAHLVANINVTTGGALTGSGGTLDTPATDAALLAAVASLWSTIAGCITNP